MKIVWFTSTPVITTGLLSSGTWISSMYNALKEQNIDIINIALTAPYATSFDNKDTIILKAGANSRKKPAMDLVNIFKNHIEEINPDLIHIWGTEWNGSYIAMKAYLRVPVLISIQGMASILKNHVLGTLGIQSTLRWLTVHDLFAPSGLLSLYKSLYRTGKMELQVVNKMEFFECATPFMEAWVRSINPKAKIYNCPSVLRKDFYNNKWLSSNYNRYTLFLPDATTTYKGFDVMLKAAKILIREFPELQLRIAGPVPRKGFFIVKGYERYINHLLNDEEIKKRVTFLGPLTSDKLSKEMLSSNAVVISSIIESQGLVLLEAMMLGVPTIASYAGGMPDLFTHNYSAIGYPVGDSITLAHSIRKLFTNISLTEEIAENSYRIAQIRNNREMVSSKLIGIYSDIFDQNNI